MQMAICSQDHSNLALRMAIGHYKTSNGFEYIGDWLNGYQTGFGAICYKNGDLYEGDVQNGLRNGEGRFFSVV